MCYAAPGPRCSSHAKKELQKAIASGDEKAIKIAKENYLTTPEGIQTLRDKGKNDLADKAQAVRDESIRLFNVRKDTLKHIESEIGNQGWDDSYKEKSVKAIQKFTSLYGTPSIGRTRAVFDTNDGFVIKVPYADEGFYANHAEVVTSDTENAYIPIAKCRHDEKEGVSVLVMEKVSIARADYKNMPDWVYSVDCGQVGYTKDGRLVAYDL